MNLDLSFPTDDVQLNETKSRLIAGLVLLTTIIYLLSGWLILPVLLVVDFGVRSFDFDKYSPFGDRADWAIKTFHLPYKGVDRAPKRFAARMGLGFGILISGLCIAEISTIIPAITLAIIAMLESLAGFSAGCSIYTFYGRLFSRAV